LGRLVDLNNNIMNDCSNFEIGSLLTLHKAIFDVEIKYFQNYIVEVSIKFEKTGL
jgi:hypothetical protein